MQEISRRQFAVYLVVVVLVVLLGGRALRADGGSVSAGAIPAGGFTAQPEPGTGASGSTGGGGGLQVTTDTGRSLVHVAGAVRHPGVYELAADARVRDAVARAGGGRAGADLDALNLAAKVTDGQQVLVARRVRAAVAGAAPVPAPGAAPGATVSAAAGAPAASAGPVNINQADVTQLEALNGVGPAIAQKIVNWRTQNGPFKTPDDLAQVAGIGPKKLEAMRAQVIT